MHARTATANRAFTLIELLVCIGIIAVVIGLTLPALAGARTTARQTKALANQRTAYTTFSQYAGQYGSYPYAARGVRTRTNFQDPPDHLMLVPWWPQVSFVGTTEPFDLEWLWPGVVSLLTDWPEAYPAWVSPGLPTSLPTDFPDELRDTISVRYSHTFLARPALFTDGAPSDDALRGATKPDDVAFPSQKVMLWDAHLAYLRNEPRRIGEFYDAPTPMAFADGHADAKNPAAARPGVPNPLRGGLAPAIKSTRDGVRGIDY